ncbi:acetate kinase [Marinicauda salina]|uniref:Acetate kinase n=1 Tax=Marinicauda salina TaxID=2135793 RepID=A0A2U2BWW5_9PROT|nr:acetate/propionate family kinase [Marinicauda salina]PWE18505.1 acetate kinase [Marinicauda salina]
MTDAVLVLNVGSSSVKLALYALDDVSAARLRGRVTGIGTRPEADIVDADGVALAPGPAAELAPKSSHPACLDALLAAVADDAAAYEVRAVGHRIVHGGRDHAEPVAIDDAVRDALEALTPLAPGHQPHNLAGVDAARKRWPEAIPVACFDTAFHRTQPRQAELFALPRAYADRGVIRYGFHGLSYEHIAAVAPDIVGEAARGRLIAAHLGHGASLCAMRDGKSVATTMGFTALDGLPMARRSGAIDPGVLLHLLQEDGMSPEAVADLLHNRSGLYGLSGVSDDMRDLLASDDPNAAEAVEHFCYRAAREIGGLAATLGGLDALVFTAGIGEHAAPVRARIVELCGWLGADLDPAANAADGPRISTADSTVSAWVIPTDEESRIARGARTVLQAGRT